MIFYRGQIPQNVYINYYTDFYSLAQPNMNEGLHMHTDSFISILLRAAELYQSITDLPSSIVWAFMIVCTSSL